MNAMPRDIRIPADSADQLTTNAKSAIPPVEFRVVREDTVNGIYITDRQGVQNRQATVSYRVYFLPSAFAPDSIGTTATVPSPVVFQTITRAAGRQAASLVTEISAPGLGTVLYAKDSTNVGRSGFYYCVAVNRSGVEAPSEQIVKAPK